MKLELNTILIYDRGSHQCWRDTPKKTMGQIRKENNILLQELKHSCNTLSYSTGNCRPSRGKSYSDFIAPQLDPFHQHGSTMPTKWRLRWPSLYLMKRSVSGCSFILEVRMKPLILAIE